MQSELLKTWLKKHAAPAGLGLIALMILSMSAVAPPSFASLLHKDVVDIGVEHDQPLSLSMQVGMSETSGYIEFFSETSETILISVPSTWVRREVKNAPINTVTSEVPSLGFTRWTLPPRAGISFSVPEAPDSAVLHNPTRVQMKLDLAFVDLIDDTVHKEVVLIQDDTVKLW